MTRAVAAGLVALLLTSTSAALAHPRIDAARAGYGRADFEAALSEIEDAFDVGHLSRDEYLEALVLRALIASADRREVTRDDALRQIAAIAPEFALPPEAPPSLSQRYEAIRSELGDERVEARFDVERNEERFTARLHMRDPVRAATNTSIVCRAGEEVFQSEGRDVFGLVPAWQSVECVAQLLGRGGTVLVESRASADGEGTPPPAPCIGPDCPGQGDDGLAIGLGITLPALAIVAAILTVVLVLENEEVVEPPPSNRFVPPTGFVTAM